MTENQMKSARDAIRRGKEILSELSALSVVPLDKYRDITNSIKRLEGKLAESKGRKDA